MQKKPPKEGKDRGLPPILPAIANRVRTRDDLRREIEALADTYCKTTKGNSYRAAIIRSLVLEAASEATNFASIYLPDYSVDDLLRLMRTRQPAVFDERTGDGETLAGMHDNIVKGLKRIIDGAERSRLTGSRLEAHLVSRDVLDGRVTRTLQLWIVGESSIRVSSRISVFIKMVPEDPSGALGVDAVGFELRRPSSFYVGRDLLDELTASIRRGTARRIGLHGLPGVGKTELALQLAYAVRDQFTHPQRFVDARGSSELHATPGDMYVQCLPEWTNSRQPVLEDVLARIGDTPALLIFDEVNEIQAAALVGLAPRNALLIVTANAPLQIADVIWKRVNVLSAHDALLLLLRNSGRLEAQDETALVDDDLLDETSVGGESATAIVARCGHLPIAISAAAFALRAEPTLSLHEFAEELTADATLLDLPTARGVSLKVVFDAALKRLPDDALTLFGQLSLFHSPFDRQDVSAVFSDVGLRAFRTLLLSGLVETYDARRYGMHGVVSAHARDRYAASATADEQVSDLIRFCRYFADMANMIEVGCRVPELDSPLPLLARNHALNIQFALRWALEHLDVARDACVKLVTAVVGDSGVTRAGLRRSVPNELLDQAMKMVNEHPDEPSFLCLAPVISFRDVFHPIRATSYAQLISDVRALDAAAQACGRADISHDIAQLVLIHGDDDGTIPDAIFAIERMLPVENESELWLRPALVRYRYYAGETRAALTFVRECDQKQYGRHGNPTDQGEWLLTTADVFAASGDLTTALERANAALEIPHWVAAAEDDYYKSRHRPLHERLHMSARAAIARYLVQLGRLDEARPILPNGIDPSFKYGTTAGDLCVAFATIGSWDEATAFATYLIDIGGTGIEMRIRRVLAHHVRANYRERLLGDPGGAADDLQAATAVLAGLGIATVPLHLAL